MMMQGISFLLHRFPGTDYSCLLAVIQLFERRPIRSLATGILHSDWLTYHRLIDIAVDCLIECIYGVNKEKQHHYRLKMPNNVLENLLY